MADGSTIEWTDATWQITTGCNVVSPGCTNCYAMHLAGTRLQHHPSRKGLTQDTKAGPVWNGEVRFNEQWLDQPLRWKSPRRIFVSAHGDLFHESVPDEWIDKVFAVMALAQRHTFQILTKRATRMRAYLTAADAWERVKKQMGRIDNENMAKLETGEPGGIHVGIEKMPGWEFLTGQPCHPGCSPPCEMFWLPDGKRDVPAHLHDGSGRKAGQCYGCAFYDGPLGPLPNVWLGVSVEDQARADERIPDLLATPAAVRFISAEPLLGPIDLTAWLPNAHLIKTARRDWGAFSWPSWVPASVREGIESFWRTDYGRGPDAWMRSAVDNGQPPIGTLGDFHTCRRGEPLVRGRFVPAWNNIGRVVDEHGDTHVVSAGIYQSRPPRLDWVIVGGESGPQARPMHPNWARSLRDQCQAAGVPFFFKQSGEWVPWHEDMPWKPAAGCAMTVDGRVFDDARAINRTPAHTEFVLMTRVGKKGAGRLLDGVTHDEMPG